MCFCSLLSLMVTGFAEMGGAETTGTLWKAGFARKLRSEGLSVGGGCCQVCGSERFLGAEGPGRSSLSSRSMSMGALRLPVVLGTGVSSAIASSMALSLRARAAALASASACDDGGGGAQSEPCDDDGMAVSCEELYRACTS
ncbi:hypothetical protein EXIGLDRAFT_330904 [Exidia glandulosa HHB12029]|uniref:Secreted protein n=1 Tax=Exidia glandulosa HHB12029 TaxID=1314781 RepID=A0A165CRS9_EXIGL|nr:hypothetical protein EXIGLDRAFT_330904 [Exidia glandulosa HHB12029]